MSGSTRHLVAGMDDRTARSFALEAAELLDAVAQADHFWFEMDGSSPVVWRLLPKDGLVGVEKWQAPFTYFTGYWDAEALHQRGSDLPKEVQRKISAFLRNKK